MSGRVRMVKWTRELMKNYKPPTPKQLERHKIREQKIMKEIYESDLHEITWDKKCVLRNKDYIEYLLIPRHPIFFSYLKSPVTLIFSIIEPLKSFSNLSKVYLTALKPDAFALTSSF
jgi:hypothetical protein